MAYVFISYSTMNQKEADIVKQYLKKQHINTWMAPENIPAGSRYAQVINKALKECACVVLLLTDEAQNSIWVDKEIERALNYRKTVIPIQVGELLLNDAFEFYISTNQVITVQKVDADSDEMEKVLTSVRKCVERETFSDGRGTLSEETPFSQKNILTGNKAVSKEDALPEEALCKEDILETKDSPVRKRELVNPWKEISLVGIGGCGCHTVGRLVERYFHSVSAGQEKSTGGLKDRLAIDYHNLFIADSSREDLLECHIAEERKFFIDNDMNVETICYWILEHVRTKKVIFLCGLGGKTGSRYADLFAEAAKRAGKFTIVAAYMPFMFENRKRENTFYKFNEIKMNVDVDCFAYYDNDSLMRYMLKNSSMQELYRTGDHILFQGICELCEKPEEEIRYKRYRIRSRKCSADVAEEDEDSVIKLDAFGRVRVELEEM